jgi:hypothetical protein
MAVSSIPNAAVTQGLAGLKQAVKAEQAIAAVIKRATDTQAAANANTTATRGTRINITA